MPQGRPLAFAFPPIITYFGVHLTDNLICIYAIGALFCSVNAFLLFLILRRWLTLPSAIIGAFVFLLTPADTTKILLTHNLVLQPSIFCALLGIFFYLKQKKIYYVLAYIFGVMTLLFYESGILIFLFAPFFVLPVKRKFWNRILVHIILIISLIILMILLRSISGEERVSDIASGNKLFLLFEIFSAPIIGLIGSLYAMIYGTVKGIENAIVIGFIPILFSGVIFIYWLSSWIIKNEDKISINRSRLNIPYKVQILLYKMPSELNIFLNKSSLSIDHASCICIVGFLMILSAYLLSFTHYPPTTISGRFTSVHLAATIAWGVFISGIIELILIKENIKYIKLLTISFSSIILMLWGSYAIYLQKGFSAVWEGQKQFWNEVRTLAPEIDENSIVIFDNNVKEVSKISHFGEKNVIGGAEWALPISFRIFFSDVNDINKPTAYKPVENDILWKEENGQYFFYHDGFPNWGKWYSLDSRNTIMFSMNSRGQLLRIKELLVLNNLSPASLALPQQHICSYYSLDSCKVLYIEPEYIRIKFKELSDKNLINKPKGPLYKFIEFGSFGLR
jgi:hypothetical protein